MSARILLVEDEADIALVVADLLRAEGHRVDVARDGERGREKALAEAYDLLILDVMLPGCSGYDLCNVVRERGFDGGILMLTARGQVKDRVEGLKTGADDYVVKPFDSDELLARVDALLRRVNKRDLTPLMQVEFGENRADFTTMTFTRQGRKVELAAKEAELLRFLINHRGQVLTRDRILQHVWKEQVHITARTVDVHVAWLRQKLEEDPGDPKHILTVRGEGYRFQK